MARRTHLYDDRPVVSRWVVSKLLCEMDRLNDVVSLGEYSTLELLRYGMVSDECRRRGIDPDRPLTRNLK